MSVSDDTGVLVVTCVLLLVDSVASTAPRSKRLYLPLDGAWNAGGGTGGVARIEPDSSGGTAGPGTVFLIGYDGVGSDLIVVV